MNGQTSLRERKKAETRSALSMAAMRLAVERGGDGVTEDEIAAAANVSLRTFHNYFGSKEEAIAAAFRELLQRYADALRDRPANESIWDALEHVCVQLVGGYPAEPNDLADQLRMLGVNSGGPAYLIAFEEVGRLFVETVASRTGTNAETDVYPRLVTGVIGVAVRVALTPMRGRAEQDPASVVREAFAMLRAGMPPPPQVSKSR